MKTKFKINVGNKYKQDVGINIMRGTPLGNPFVMHDESERDTVCYNYQLWIIDQYINRTEPAYGELMRLCELAKTQSITLICCCHPKACHGDVLARIIPTLNTSLTQINSVPSPI